MHNVIRTVLLSFLLCLHVISTGHAEGKAVTKLDLKAFSTLPILHEGRIKPIDSYARAQRKMISGTESHALLWAIDMMFNPARAEQARSIKINNPELLAPLNIQKHKSRLYSFAEVSAALAQKQELITKIMAAPETEWSKQQHDLIDLQHNTVTMQQMLGDLSLFLPLSFDISDIDTAQYAFLKPYHGKTLSFWNSRDIHDDIHKAVRMIVAEHKEQHDTLEHYSEAEKKLALLSYTLDQLRAAQNNTHMFRALPQNATDNAAAAQTISWYTPWGMALNSDMSAETEAFLDHWQALVFAYHNNNPVQWNTAIERIARETYIAAKHARPDIRPVTLMAEYYYNIHNPFYISFILCLGACAFLIIGLFYPPMGQGLIVTFPLCTSIIAQIIGLSARMYILERPPVSTLYETVLFVTVISMAYILLFHRRENVMLWLCALLGAALHILGFSHNQNGDSMLMLTAVLNTNFWLATHVICITAGYAFCALTAVFAHYTLLHMVMQRTTQPSPALMRHTHMAALLALFFATIGTVLGGIWADQSWGRFWGWDPKENGALLIVLWLIWGIHGRISGQMRNVGYLCTMAYLSVILALSWFGVNLLSVGLHAYGFSDGTAFYLGLFTSTETLFILITMLMLHKKYPQKDAHA